MFDRTVLLMILDGFGININHEGNAIKLGNTQNLDKYFEKYPNTIIKTSGMNVGLPNGQMGNSEVGHMNIGAGRVVYQELTRISKSIEDGEFFTNNSFIHAIDNCKKNNSSLHLLGLLSDGGVHSHNEHLYALLKLAKQNGVAKVYVHCFMDGRDVSPTSGKNYIQELENKLQELELGKIATIMGRYYAMDRDNRWDRIELAYNALVLGKGKTFNSSNEAIIQSYEENVTDEFVIPSVITDNEIPVATIKENDSIIFFNFRSDRARQITRAFVDDKFDGFKRINGKIPVYYVCMTEYDKTIPNVDIAFNPQILVNTFGEYISKLGYKQLRIAETEKYAHVTFFFNGRVEKVNQGEDRELIPSPKVATYDMKPEMSAYEVTDSVIKKIESNEYNFILLNYANCDMVGHTGDLNAAIRAVSSVDECVKKVVDSVLEQNGIVIITADHGNAEKMIEYETGKPYTAHTTFDVPLTIIGLDNIKLQEGKLSDIAPTILEIMKEKIPVEMTGESIIIKN